MFSPSEVELMLGLVAAAAARQVVWVLGNHETSPQDGPGPGCGAYHHGGDTPTPQWPALYSPEPGRAAAGGRPWGLPGSRLRPLATVGPLE